MLYNMNSTYEVNAVSCSNVLLFIRWNSFQNQFLITESLNHMIPEPIYKIGLINFKLASVLVKITSQSNQHSLFQNRTGKRF